MITIWFHFASKFAWNVLQVSSMLLSFSSNPSFLFHSHQSLQKNLNRPKLRRCFFFSHFFTANWHRSCPIPMLLLVPAQRLDSQKTHTVWWFRNKAIISWFGKYPLQGFIHPRCRIFSINSIISLSSHRIFTAFLFDLFLVDTLGVEDISRSAELFVQAMGQMGFNEVWVSRKIEPKKMTLLVVGGVVQGTRMYTINIYLWFGIHIHVCVYRTNHVILCFDSFCCTSWFCHCKQCWGMSRFRIIRPLTPWDWNSLWE